MATKKSYNLRCFYCGKFCSAENLFVYTPWGSTLDLEPPEDEYICRKCLTPEEKKLLLTMWHPVQPLIGRRK